VFPVGRAKLTTKRGAPVKCWDVRWRVDGWDFSKRFTQPTGTAAQAQEWARRLQDEYARGWEFDPKARRFESPPQAASREVITVYEASLAYLDRNWRRWEPRTRQAVVRALKRLCEHLLTAEAPEPPDSLIDSLEILLTPVRPEITNSDAEQFLRLHSSPINLVGWQDIERIALEYRKNRRQPAKEVSAATEQRFLADVRQFFADSAARYDLDDPYARYRRLAPTRKRHKLATEVVPGEAVLSPGQLKFVALLCSFFGPYGGVAICFVLVMGLSGLRPGEAAGLLVGDLTLPEEGHGWVTVRRTRRRIAAQWLTPEEDLEWGPLKGRHVGESRRVPIPADLVKLLRFHIEYFCGPRDRSTLVFSRNGAPLDSSIFFNDVWIPARTSLLSAITSVDEEAAQSLSGVRPHDLRHAACSLWLNSEVDLKVCQRWSGHRSLKVFLDIYQGILPGREDEGADKVDAAVRSAWGTR
jgi:integrase